MKTFKEILDIAYEQAEINEEELTFLEYSTDQILAIQFALSEIWEEYDYKFKERSTTFDTIEGQIEYNLPYGKIKDEGLKVSTATSPMSEIENADSLSDLSGIPEHYYLENNELNLYPNPDDGYSITMKYLTDHKAKDAEGAEKDTLENEDDVLNIPAYMETHFITVLAYKTAVNKISDPTDEVYVHAKTNYDNALKLLITKSKRSTAPPRFVIG